MSKDNIPNMIKLRRAGWTYQEIADKHDCTKQYVHSSIAKYVDSVRSPRRSSLEKCIYPNIRKWMIENRIKALHLSRICGLEDNGSKIIQGKLRGESEFKMKEIKAILKESGQTFEYMFSTEDTDKI